MSMMCCEKCGSCVDTDYHPEMFRTGFVHVHKQALIKTGNEKDCAAICDYCFDCAGFEEE